MYKAHILVVDDDKRLLNLLAEYLSQQGFLVTALNNPLEVENILNVLKVDLAIMDVMMPKKSGIELTKELKEKGYNFPILMLTAMGNAEDRINGLEQGADDYLTKPFEVKELLLRMNNLLKRAIPSKTNLALLGDFYWQFKNNTLLYNNELVPLTSAQTELLKLLADSVPFCTERVYLANQLGIDERAIDVQITRLRKKLEEFSSTTFIQTVRGKGYILLCI